MEGVGERLEVDVILGGVLTGRQKWCLFSTAFWGQGGLRFGVSSHD